MKSNRDRHLTLITFSVFLIAFGWMLTVLFEDTVHAVILPLALETEPEENSENEKSDEQKPRKQPLLAVDVRYSADISETAIEEMEKGRFLVETELPGGSARTQVFQQLRSRGGILVAEDLDNTYHLLTNGGLREPLEEAAIEHSAYAFHRPRKIATADLRRLAINTNKPGDVPFLVMPKVFEAQIISEIERALNDPVTNYKAARLSLSTTSGGHLRLTINEVTKTDGQTFTINRSITGL